MNEGLPMDSSIPAVEVAAAPLRPVASWVTVIGADGRRRPEMIWTVPDPWPQAVELAWGVAR